MAEREIWVLERFPTPAYVFPLATFGTREEAEKTALDGETPMRYVPESDVDFDKDCLAACQRNGKTLSESLRKLQREHAALLELLVWQHELGGHNKFVYANGGFVARRDMSSEQAATAFELATKLGLLEP